MTDRGRFERFEDPNADFPYYVGRPTRINGRKREEMIREHIHFNWPLTLSITAHAGLTLLLVSPVFILVR